MSLYHSGCRLDIQSKAATVTVRAKRAMKTGAKRRARRFIAGSWLESCAIEPPRKNRYEKIQTPAQKRVRAQKKGTFSHADFATRMGWCAASG